MLLSRKQWGANNDTFYYNPRVDALLAEAAPLSDLARRYALYERGRTDRRRRRALGLSLQSGHLRDSPALGARLRAQSDAPDALRKSLALASSRQLGVNFGQDHAQNPSSPHTPADAVAHLKRADPDSRPHYRSGRAVAHFSSTRSAFRPWLARSSSNNWPAPRRPAIYDRFAKQIGGARFPTPAQVLAATDEAMRAAVSPAAKWPICATSPLTCATVRSTSIASPVWRTRNYRATSSRHGYRALDCRDVPDVQLAPPRRDAGETSAAQRSRQGLRPRKAAHCPKELLEFAERWRPYRTAAAWYLWQSLRVIDARRSRSRLSHRLARPRVPSKPPTEDCRAHQNQTWH